MGNWKGFLMIGSLLLQQGSWEEGFLNLRKAVMCGYSAKDMFDNLRNGYRLGYITKEEFAFTLRENMKANNEMKSESRDIVRKKLEEEGRRTFTPSADSAKNHKKGKKKGKKKGRK